MYCVVFVTDGKIKIPHKGCYFTYGNIVMKTKILRSVDETNENIQTSCNTYTNLANIKLYFCYLMVAILNEMAKAFFSINIWSIKYISWVFHIIYGLQKSCLILYSCLKIQFKIRSVVEMIFHVNR